MTYLLILFGVTMHETQHQFFFIVEKINALKIY